MVVVSLTRCRSASAVNLNWVARRWLLAAVTLAVVVATRNAQAAGSGAERRSCMMSYKAAEVHATASHLRYAKVLMLKCARPVCGAAIRRVCILRAAQLQEDIPTVVPMIKGGATPENVRFTMDGELLTSTLDGSAVSVDPGAHDFSFATVEGVLGTESVVIVQGQRNRPIAITFKGAAAPSPKEVAAGDDLAEALAALPPAPRKPAARPAADPERLVEAAPPPVEPRASGRSVGPYLLGVVGLAGVGGYALLTYWGRQDNALLAQCTPACPQASVDHVRRRYLEADISLAAGGAVLAASTVWLLLRSGPSSAEGKARASYSLDVQPADRGAVARVAGLF
jgi:hypothetical protein